MTGFVIAVLCLIVLLALAMAYDRRQRHRGRASDIDERSARETSARSDGNTGGGYSPSGGGFI
ncbi:hypothetical protein [Terrabacter lapilli]